MLEVLVFKFIIDMFILDGQREGSTWRGREGGEKTGKKKTFISIFNFWEDGKLIQRQKVHYSATGNKLSCGASKRTPQEKKQMCTN